MLRLQARKVILVLLVLIFGCGLAVPNLFSPETRQAIEQGAPSWIPRFLLPIHAMTLGLDLQGGSHVLLEIDRADLIRGQVTQLRDDVRRILREERISFQGGIVTTQRGAQVRVSDAAERAKLLPKLRELAQPIGTLGAFGPSGNSSIDITEQPDGLVQLSLTEAGINERVRRATEQAIEVIRRRIDETGTKEPSIQRQGLDRILVQVPGLQDPQQLKELLGRTAKLQFRLLAEQNSGDVDMLPSKDSGGQLVPVSRQVIVEGADLIDAQPAFDQRTGQPIVNFRFNIRGAQRFGQATTENLGRALAIVLDNEVISAPVIQSPITGGSGQISGNFTPKSVNDLAILLRAGALPAKMTIVEERTVGPGLGADSIRAGKLATLIATVLVILYMIGNYGLFGIIASVALLVHVCLILGLMSLLGATMTLPGIAGIVLTIGTAVDSNVLIYERMREESHLGRSLVSALEAGFQRAFATIIDSNVTMLIAAVALFTLGSGPVRGFAVVFILGILTTVITAVTLTRMLIAVWYRWARPKALPF
ncbi:protein translocase subunit SecD [Bosea caraganae]|uniref:Protein translocase subunit SecD n=1 Tax=Bosea caraganae TaxID=2763117 RepID=A0A370LCF2_9HYPH|nr:protein translocase subunit SecD [Bosea caraganae]RDJ27639.1 protein translocase subunit SecD [Bosea caraganae]RDJ29653.1 protein translocase subunit SecD [Bosea caraganae]